MRIPPTLIGLMLLLSTGQLRLEAQLTEVPTTAPVGGWLWEIDVLSAAVDKRTPLNDGTHYRSTTMGSVLVSTGLNERWDVQFGFEIWREEKVYGSGLSHRDSGQGDAWLRTKWNFAGDEGSGPAWAVLPYIKLPLADHALGNDEFEPGLVLIFAHPVNAANQWHANLGLDVLNHGAGNRDMAIYGSTAFTRNCTDEMAIYAEFNGWVDAQDAQNWSGEIAAGMTYAFHERGWLDIALYLGLTTAAPDYTPVLRGGWQF